MHLTPNYFSSPGSTFHPHHLASMGNNSDKMYVTYSEHAAGHHTASGGGKRGETGKSDFQRLPL